MYILTKVEVDKLIKKWQDEGIMMQSDINHTHLALLKLIDVQTGLAQACENTMRAFDDDNQTSGHASDLRRAITDAWISMRNLLERSRI